MNSHNVEVGEHAHTPFDPVSVDATLGALRAAVAALLDAANGAASTQELSTTARIVEARARELAQRLEQRQQPADSAEASPVAEAGRFRVLVVEDDAQHSMLLEDGLSPWFDVICVATEREAEEVLRRDLPDVVLTDLCLASSSGLELIELVRAAGDPTQVPVLVLSGRSDTTTKVHAFEAGAFDFISKPYDVDELVARIRNALTHAQLVRRERQLGGRDDLTGLANRRAFRTCLESSARAARLTETPIAVIVIDQDRLKYINDTWGHAAGDDALRLLSESLAASTRGSDCAARIGGDEFALVVPGCDREGARALLARVDEALRRRPLNVAPGTAIVISASFGVACLGERGDDETVEQLLRRADAELYAHKRRHPQGD